MKWEDYGQQLDQWRDKWAERGAKELEKAGFNLEAERWRVGHLNLERQRQSARERGDLAHLETLNREPTAHRGPTIDAMEKKGQQTERGNIRRDIEQRDQDAAALKIELAKFRARMGRHGYEGPAARATANDNRPQAAPENMGRTGATIWLAYTSSHAPQDFAAALEHEGMALAVVTNDEAERSHREAEFAKAVGNWAPRYGAGEIVAVSPGAYVYRLDEKRTGDDRAQVERFFAPLDRSPLQGIEATKAIMHERAETREADNLRKARSRVTPDEAERGGLVAHQMWALERVRDADQQRREQDRREYSEKQKRDSAEPDNERYRRNTAAKCRTRKHTKARKKKSATAKTTCGRRSSNKAEIDESRDGAILPGWNLRPAQHRG